MVRPHSPVAHVQCMQINANNALSSSESSFTKPDGMVKAPVPQSQSQSQAQSQAQAQAQAKGRSRPQPCTAPRQQDTIMRSDRTQNNNREKKTVRFKPSIRIKEVRHRKNMTREMVKDIYLGEDDYSNIKTVIRQTVLLLMDGHEPSFIEHDGTLCVRGLEGRTRYEQRQRMKKRTKLRRAIMTEQQNQRQQDQNQNQNQNEDDRKDERLSRICRIFSDQCVADARRTAMKDAVEARVYLSSTSTGDVETTTVCGGGIIDPIEIW